jgi:predicted dehydrogenase
MLDKLHNKIDAIVVATPDHAHFPIAMAAVKGGKHVFVESPMCQTIAQVRELQAAAAAAGVKTQMGNQGHSSDRVRELKEWADGGVFGSLMSVQAWTDRPTGCWPQGQKYLPAAEAVPRALNWDLWRNGVDLPYSSKYLPFRWRGWTMWGSGAMGDMACHILDPMFFALDPGMPDWVRAEAEGGTAVSFPVKSTIVFHFPARKDRSAFEMTWYDGKDNRPTRPGMLELGIAVGNEDGGSILYGSRATVMTDSHARDIRVIPDMRMQELKPTLPAPSLPRVAGEDHFRNWTDAIRGKVEQACSHFDYAGRLNELVLLGVIAQRIPGVQLEWDTAAMKFTNHDLANQLVSHCRI